MPPRNYRNSPRRSRLPRVLIGGFGLVALLVAGVVGTLWISGVPLNPFAQSAETEDPFMVRIPINSQPIPAYTRVERAQLLNPAKGGLMFQKIPPDAVVGMAIVGVDNAGSHVESKVESVKNEDDTVVFVVTGGAEVRQSRTFTLGGAMLNVNAIIGRVVKKDKRVGLGFTENTFFPKGTPEGLAGATPKGMRAITLDATKLTGVHSLGTGDQIDLLANVPSDGDDGASEVELIAQTAKVLRPVYVRNEVSSSATLLQGNQVKNDPKYEVAIAVNADDVIRLQNAINRELSITCIAHSMKPLAEGESDQLIQDPDVVRVPVTVRPILAYNVVSRDAFVSQATRSIKSETISRQEADRIGAITSLTDALGAIVRQDIPAGRYLRRADLLNGPPTENSVPVPADLEASAGQQTVRRHKVQFVSMQQDVADSPQAPAATAVGDRPAITRFIPAGRTAFAIPLNQMYGGEHLQIGDSIDLMASYSLERLRDEEETETRPDGTVIVRKSESLTPRITQRNWEDSFGNRAEPWFVASNAIVVAPVGFPAPASALRALANPLAGTENNNRNARRQNSFGGPPVIIAVDDRDVEAVATALATRDALFSVAFHSSNSPEPDNRGNAQFKRIVIAPEPIAAFTTVGEFTWQGNRRRMLTQTVSAADSRYTEALTESSMREYYGRVLASDKQRGEPLTPADFLPQGSRAGIAASGREGFSFLPIADREIEGLDSFETGDRVAVLIRAVIQRESPAVAALGFQPAVASVVSQSVRIAKASVAGQTILEVSHDELATFQAALARSLSDREAGDRSHLVAVGLHRQSKLDLQVSDGTTAAEIRSFDPLAGIQTTEVIVGSQRSVQVFLGQDGP